MFMDISSEMIHSLLPVFLITVLGASAATVGLIEGIGEATASISKLFSGWLSDRLGKRKMLTVIGYSLATLTKPIFALAPSAGWVLTARITDRVGKGIRGAPRDALVADITPEDQRGAAYGLRQSLDTVGAFAGPLLAIGLMVLFANDFRMVFWAALLPGAIAVAILVLVVREPDRISSPDEPRPRINRQELAELGGAYWKVVFVGTLLTLARFSEAFLILRALDNGLSIALVPLVLVVMNVVYAISAYPAGVLSDSADKRVILMVGFGVLILADIVLALSTNLWAVMAGVALWGLHMGLTQGLLATLISETAPQRLRGTAFGIFHLLTGLALLLASLMAGLFWDLIGPSATFFAGAGFTAVGLLAFYVIAREKSA
jgi:MFS family permease